MIINRYVSFKLILISTLLLVGFVASAQNEEIPANVSESRPEATSELQSEQEENQLVRQETLEANQLERQENRAQAQEQRQDIGITRQAALTERSKERITNLAANISNRFDGSINRLQNIIDRLTSRIGKLKAVGVDTGAAETSLEAAQTAINSAFTAITNIDQVVADAVSAENPRAGWSAAQAVFTEAKGHVQRSHAELKNTVDNLKVAIETNSSPATESLTE